MSYPHRKKKQNFPDGIKQGKEMPPSGNIDVLENSECVEEFKHIQNLLSPLKIDISRKEKMAKALNQIEQLDVPRSKIRLFLSLADFPFLNTSGNRAPGKPEKKAR